jgi:hypothetical protein
VSSKCFVADPVQVAQHRVVGVVGAQLVEVDLQGVPSALLRRWQRQPVHERLPAARDPDADAERVLAGLADGALDLRDVQRRLVVGEDELALSSEDELLDGTVDGEQLVPAAGVVGVLVSDHADGLLEGCRVSPSSLAATTSTNGSSPARIAGSRCLPRIDLS